MIDYEIEQLKEDEGFRAKPYKCSEGFLTIGYGTRMPLSRYESEHVLNSNEVTKEESEFLLRHRLTQYVSELVKKKPIIYKLDENRQGILFNMVYQLGVNGLLKFKKMWKALEKFDYVEASKEMLDSNWYKKQTTPRAMRLAKRMLQK